MTAEQLALALAADGVVVFASDGHELTVADAWPAHAAGRSCCGSRSASASPVWSPGTGGRRCSRRTRRATPCTASCSGWLPARASPGCAAAPGIDGSVAGVLAFHRGTDRPFAADDVAQASAYAAQVVATARRAAVAGGAPAPQRADRLIEAAISAQRPSGAGSPSTCTTA
ncbi:MAG: GAF domain-containing protein [Nocardioides sp.]